MAHALVGPNRLMPVPFDAGPDATFGTPCLHSGVDNFKVRTEIRESEMPQPGLHVHRETRNHALLAAEHDRAVATRHAEIEYSETVFKLREAFEADLASASARRNERVLPAHRAYNAAVIAAEQAYGAAKVGFET